MKGRKIHYYKHLQSSYCMLHVVQSTATSCNLVNNLITAMAEYAAQLQVNKRAESFLHGVRGILLEIKIMVMCVLNERSE